MADLVEWCLYICYAYGRLTGVLNFEVDLKTGRPRATKRATLCSVFAQLIMFSVLYVQIRKSHVMSGFWENVGALNEYVFMILGFFRIICVFLALAIRWVNRRQFMDIFHSFMRLYLLNPAIRPFCRRSIISKFFCSTLTEILQISMVLYMVRERLTLSQGVGIVGFLSMTAIINVIITQYYIAMAHLRARYVLLNKELRAVVDETQSLVPNRSGVYVTKCCFLADRLEELSKTQSELQKLTENVSSTYEVQVLCMVIAYYLHLMGNIYFIFTAIKYKGFVHSSTTLVSVFVTFFMVSYYFECWLNAHNIFHLLDVHAEMVRILDRRTLFHPGLDRRLETVFESFLLNLARNPLRLKYLAAFEVDRTTYFALLNSMLTHSILLIQYDVQNF
ncbi:hypothetical protein KR009_003604 [Drosophila setifemur]|nr:hypothetical protein KR009_003604 [Drosophila setifemur]